MMPSASNQHTTTKITTRDQTHQSFWSAVILRILQARVSDGRCVDKRSDL